MEGNKIIMLTKYLILAKKYPEIFTNPDKDGFLILLNKEDIKNVESEISRKLEAEGHPSAWARVGIVYEDQFLLILRDAVKFPNEERGTYIRIVNTDNLPAGVVVLPIFRGNVILVKHFRHATRQWHLEIPRGFSDKRISIEENATKEIEEEIGATTLRLISLGKLHTNTGLSSEFVELFIAEVDKLGTPDIKEAITQLKIISSEQLEEFINKGEITDSFTIAAYTRAKLKKLI
jgi:ADP-ribose pyrophosphatase